MAYKAIAFFKDLQDSSRAYNPGDVYPREGLLVSQKRIEELMTNRNRRGTPVIEEIPEQAPEELPAKPKRTRKKKDAD